MMTVGIFVHDLGSREVRVRFDLPVPDAETPSGYAFSSTSGYVPSIVSVSYYDADMTSVRVLFDAALTNGETYSCQISGLQAYDGSLVTTVPFDFVAADEDLPQILGAYQSTRRCVDIVCDRPVAITSTIASARIKEPGGASVAMSLVPWTADQHENSVRFSCSSAPAATEYAIQFSNIVDVSGNTCRSGEIPLDLAYEPTGYADLVQARATLATVADVSNAEGFAATVLRVFFSCPMFASDVLNESKWAVSQNGSHVAADLTNTITVPDAIDTSSFVNLANDGKAMVNAHLASHAHLVTDFINQIYTADATDYATASDLADEVFSVLSAHYERTDMHLYADHVHVLDSSILDPMNRLNSLKEKFNGHLEESYGLEFSDAYDPIGPIVNFASSGNASFVLDKYTWFADLHIASDADQAIFSISMTAIRSEDLASSVTSTILAGPVNGQPTVISVSRSFRGATVRMNCDTDVGGADLCSLTDVDQGVSVKFSVRASSSVPVLLWALNNVLQAYKMHISYSTYPLLGALHKIPDVTNTVSFSNYATDMDLDVLIQKANWLKWKIDAHMTSELYHYGADVPIEVPDAVDFDSLERLILSLRNRLSRHNSSGFSQIRDIIPATRSLHVHPGAGIVSANVGDLVVVFFDGAMDGNSLVFKAPVLKTWKDNRPNVVERVNPGFINVSFVASDSLPILTSAVARPGFSASSPSPYLMSDMIELYLSKPMRNQTISMGTNIVITGASIVASDAWWTNDRTISVQVLSMLAATYSIEAFDMRDFAGNLVPTSIVF